MRTIICWSILTWFFGVSYVLAADAPTTVSTTQPIPGPVTMPTKPDPMLSPNEVVTAVLEALRTNDDKDTGIAFAFAFASPTNKQATGPLERFVPMVKSPAYAPMIGCKSVELGGAQTEADVARQFVKVVGQDGTEANYLFVLRKQKGGDVNGCWMTDGVVLVPPAATRPVEEPVAPMTEKV
jgi:hypothetical protein